MTVASQWHHSVGPYQHPLVPVPKAVECLCCHLCNVLFHIFTIEVHGTYVVEIRSEAMDFASPVLHFLLLPVPLTHQIHLTISVIFSWKVRWVREKKLAHCDNFTLHGQNEYWSTFWITVVWDFDNFFKWSLYCILCDFLVCMVPVLLWPWKACVSWEHMWMNKWRKPCVFWRL